MHPVQHFKTNFDQSAKVELQTVPHDVVALGGIQLHNAESSIRNVCFVWEDGRKAFFNYAYLIAVHLTKQEDVNKIILSFGAFTVTLEGYQLDPLFESLNDHGPKTINATPLRYTTHISPHLAVVIKIVIKSE